MERSIRSNVVEILHLLWFKEEDDKFIVMAVKTPEKIKGLLEVGFEYVCQKDDLVFLRKRK